MKSLLILLPLLAACAQVREGGTSNAAVLVNPMCMILCVGDRASPQPK